MLEIVMTNRFRKDYKLAKKRGYDLSLLDNTVNLIASRTALPDRYKDHGQTVQSMLCPDRH